MCVDAQKISKSRPERAIVAGGGRHHKPPLDPIPVLCPFQIDIMELPKTQQRNKQVRVFQDFFTKWHNYGIPSS